MTGSLTTIDLRGDYDGSKSKHQVGKILKNIDERHARERSALMLNRFRDYEPSVE